MPGKKIMSDVVIIRHKKIAPALPKIVEDTAPAPKPAEVPVIKSKPSPPPFKPIALPAKPKRDYFQILRRFSIPGLVILLIIIAGVFLLVSSVKNARMTVRLTPKSATLAVDKNIILSKSIFAGAPGETAVIFITATSTLERRGTFPGEANTAGGQKASGTVVIYNKSSKEGQLLIASTRLASPDGKIYRIPSGVVIPGFRVEGGKTIPGSKEVKVVADQPGPDYNIGLTDFTIPGFIGSPKFETIFARSKTEMTGGSANGGRVVTQSAVDKAAEAITAEAAKNLKAIVSKNPLPDYFIIPGSEEFAVTAVETKPALGEPAENFEVILTGEVRRVLVKNNDIARALVQKTAEEPKLGGGLIEITNPDMLAFRLSGYEFGGETFKLNIKGTAEIQADLDADLIKERLAESLINKADGVLKLVPGAARAEVEFKPFWTGGLPKKYLNPSGRPERIDITIVSR